MWDMVDFQGNQLPLIGNFMADPASEAKRGSMHNMGLAYQAYRPEAAQARLKALNSQMSMFAPLNAMMGQMYGQGAQFDATQALQNPLSNRAMNLGAPGGSQMLPENGEQSTGAIVRGMGKAAGKASSKLPAPMVDFGGGKKGGGERREDPKEKFSPGRMKK